MKKNLIILFGGLTVFFAAYAVITIHDTYFKWGRMWQTPAVRPHEEPILIMDKDAIPIHGGEALYRAADPATLQSPFAPATAETRSVITVTWTGPGNELDYVAILPADADNRCSRW